MVTAVSMIALGIVAGISGGLFGIGGGLIIVPALVTLLGFTQHKAQGTSLVALLAPVGIFALLNYWRAGDTDLKRGAWIALGFLLGGYLGSKLALSLPEVTMRRVFAVFLVVVAVQMFFRK